MSLKRLTADERAIYLLGKAAMRQLNEAPRDPETQQEIDAFSRWVVHWLDDDEFHFVTANTGYLFDERDEELLFGPRPIRHKK